MQTNSPQTLPALLERAATEFGDRIFVRRRHSQGGDSVTYRELLRDVRSLARGLSAGGINRGDRVALIAENSYSWILADLAITYLGAIDVPRGADTAPAELRHILSHSGCTAALGVDDRVCGELLAMRDEPPDLTQVISLSEESSLEGVQTIHQLMAGGPTADLDQMVAAAQPTDLLTIVYTSGTTADPKGVMLSHQNMANNAIAVQRVLGVRADDVFLSVLPAWHVYERMIDYLVITCGGELVYTNQRQIKDDLRTVGPTVFAAVPRIWESIHDGIINHCGKLTGFKYRLMQKVLDTCRNVGGGRASIFDRTLHRLFAATVLRPVRGVVGPRMRCAVSGGGALPGHVDDLLVGLGLPLLNGYGLTETSPVVCIRLPEHNRVGTIGPPLPDTEIEIRDENGSVLPTGEIGLLWIRGPQVMRGYYKNPETTDRVLTEDGWFNSGDLARVDEAGHFVITGRAKDTIVLSGGENVEPEPVETGIKSSTLVDQVVVLGQDEKTLGAILIPMPESLAKKVPRRDWGEKDGELTSEKVLGLFRTELDRTLTRQAGFRPCEKVARFKVRLEPLTIENGLLTPTMKVKRHEVRQQMGEMIAGLFE